MSKGILIALVLFLVAIGGYLLVRSQTPAATPGVSSSQPAVAVENGRQIIEITAKGGYFPAEIEAKAGLPTTLRVQTKGTFDCSSALRIPSLDVSKMLPPTGTTDIDLGAPAPGKLAGTCSMGMYPFEIDFKE